MILELAVLQLLDRGHGVGGIVGPRGTKDRTEGRQDGQRAQNGAAIKDQRVSKVHVAPKGHEAPPGAKAFREKGFAQARSFHPPPDPEAGRAARRNRGCA